MILVSAVRRSGPLDLGRVLPLQSHLFMFSFPNAATLQAYVARTEMRREDGLRFCGALSQDNEALFVVRTPVRRGC